MTIYSLDVLLFLFGTSLLFHVQFSLLLPDLHTDFSRGRSITGINYLQWQLGKYVPSEKSLGSCCFSIIELNSLSLETLISWLNAQFFTPLVLKYFPQLTWTSASGKTKSSLPLDTCLIKSLELHMARPTLNESSQENGHSCREPNEKLWKGKCTDLAQLRWRH